MSRFSIFPDAINPMNGSVSMNTYMHTMFSGTKVTKALKTVLLFCVTEM